MSARVIAIAGATASGKSALALQLAQRLGGEIVSCDSMQIYKLLDIGTAKPTADERRAVPHHLVDFLPPEQRYSVADYVRDARRAIADIQNRGKTAILCGGTGLYMRALLQGMEFSEQGSDLALRAALKAQFQAEGAAPFLQEIAEADAAFAKTLAPADEKRILRAVELLRTTGKTVPQQNQSARTAAAPDAACFFLHYPNRQTLYNRIGRRVEQMMQQGLLAEAELVYRMRQQYTTAAAAIGYKEFFPYFENSAPLSACVEKMCQATRNYAKRQLTWFRREPEFLWLDAETQSAAQLSDLVIEMWNRGNAT